MSGGISVDETATVLTTDSVNSIYSDYESHQVASDTLYGAIVSSEELPGQAILDDASSADVVELESAGSDVLSETNVDELLTTAAAEEGKTVGNETFEQATIETVLPEDVSAEEQESILPADATDYTEPGMVENSDTTFGAIVSNDALLGDETPVPAAIGGTNIVSAGETEIGMVLSNGVVPYQSQIVLGSSLNTQILFGGNETVAENGVTSDVSVYSGGTQNIISQGTTFGTIVLSGGIQLVKATGLSFGTNKGGASRTIVSNGGLQLVSGGEAKDASIFAGGIQMVADGGWANGGALIGGTQFVDGGSVEVDVTNIEITSNGSQLILVQSGNGSISGTIIHHGLQEIWLGALVTVEDTLVGSQGIQNIYGGSAIQNTINSGGIQNLRGGTATQTTINSGGTQNISGGTANRIVVKAGGKLDVSSGGVAQQVSQYVDGAVSMEVYGGDATTRISGSLIDGPGATFLLSGGVASGFYLYETAVQTIHSGGVASDTKIFFGGFQHVSGGVASSTALLGDGRQDIHSGGVADNTTIEGAGKQMVSSGGTAIATVVNVGEQQILAGGVAVNTVVNGGAGTYQAVDTDGRASNTIVNSGGIQAIATGGSTSQTTINSGGIQFVNVGAVIQGTTLVGGSMYLEGSATVTAADIIYDLTQRTTADTEIVNDVACLSGANSFAISINGTQRGRYALAGNAGMYTQEVFLTLDGVTQATSFEMVGDVSNGIVVVAANNEQIMYQLVREADNVLYLDVKDQEAASVNVTLAGTRVDIWDYQYSLREAVEHYAVACAIDGLATVIFDAGLEGVSDSGALNFTIDTLISGNGIEDTTISCGGFYGDGHDMAFQNLTVAAGNFSGGGADRDTVGDIDVSFDGVQLSHTAAGFVTAGAVTAAQDCLIDGSLTLSIKDSVANRTMRIAAAGYAAGHVAQLTGSVTLTISDSSVGFVYGGGWALNGGEVRVEQDVNITVSGDSTVGTLFAGGYILSDGTGVVSGTITTTITGGTFASFVGNGAAVATGGTATQHDSNLTISGGTFNGMVYAGAYSNGGTGMLTGDATLTISGGTFNGKVFGGNLGNRVGGMDYSTRTNLIGNTYLFINASQTIQFNANIYAGSSGTGNISGNSNITISGLGSNLQFGSLCFISGESELSQTNQNHVAGSRNLTFSGFTGELNAVLTAFTSFTITSDSYVKYMAGADHWQLSRVDHWDFGLGAINQAAAAGGALIWDSGVNDFNGDTINLRFEDSLLGIGDTATVLATTDANVIYGWENATVQFHLSTGSGSLVLNTDWDEDLLRWVSTDSAWAFSREADGNNLIVTRLA